MLHRLAVGEPYVPWKSTLAPFTNYNFRAGTHELLLVMDGLTQKRSTPIDEVMGPYEHNCPLYMFDLVPEPNNEYAKAFRQRVRAYHAAKKVQAAGRKTLMVGQTVVCHAGVKPNQFKLSSVKPLRGYADNGLLYRLKPGQIDYAATQEAKQ